MDFGELLNVCCGFDIVTRLCGVVVGGVNLLGVCELHYEAMSL